MRTATTRTSLASPCVPMRSPTGFAPSPSPTSRRAKRTQMSKCYIWNWNWKSRGKADDWTVTPDKSLKTIILTRRLNSRMMEFVSVWLEVVKMDGLIAHHVIKVSLEAFQCVAFIVSRLRMSNQSILWHGCMKTGWRLALCFAVNIRQTALRAFAHLGSLTDLTHVSQLDLMH